MKSKNNVTVKLMGYSMVLMTYMLVNLIFNNTQTLEYKHLCSQCNAVNYASKNEQQRFLELTLVRYDLSGFPLLLIFRSWMVYIVIIISEDGIKHYCNFQL